MMRYVIDRRLTLRGRRWFWRLIAGNGEIIAQGHTRGYSRPFDARHAVELVKGSALAPIEQNAPPFDGGMVGHPPPPGRG